jgi:hypothetical protein
MKIARRGRIHIKEYEFSYNTHRKEVLAKIGSSTMIFISQSGEASPTYKARHLPDKKKLELFKLLCELNDSINNTVVHYGRLSKHCCMCQQELTHPISIALGIGPKCAAKLGIAWEMPPASLQSLLEPEKIPLDT